jgi:peroxiredoxin
MVAVNSTMLELGTPAPDFALIDVTSNKKVTLQELKGSKATVIAFTCNHCPFAIHVDAQLAQLGKDYQGPDVNIIAICSNDADNYPGDAPEKLAEQARREGYTFPYLHDADQSVALAYTASCTPDFFVFDGDLKLAYRGQLDDSRPNNGKEVTGADLRAAVEALVAGTPLNEAQKPSIGCNIKWKPGNAPDYFPG